MGSINANNAVNKADKKKSWEVTISTSSWSSAAGGWVAKPVVSGIKEEDNFNIYQIFIETSAENKMKEKEEYNKLFNAVVAAGGDKIEIYCYEDKPTVNLKIRIEVTY